MVIKNNLLSSIEPELWFECKKSIVKLKFSELSRRMSTKLYPDYLIKYLWFWTFDKHYFLWKNFQLWTFNIFNRPILITNFCIHVSSFYKSDLWFGTFLVLCQFNQNFNLGEKIFVSVLYYFYLISFNYLDWWKSLVLSVCVFERDCIWFQRIVQIFHFYVHWIPVISNVGKVKSFSSIFSCNWDHNNTCNVIDFSLGKIIICN